MNKTELMNKIKEEASVFCNYSVIFDKVLKDEYLETFYNCIEKIFFKEANFAVKGKLKRTWKTQNQWPFIRCENVIGNQHVYI